MATYCWKCPLCDLRYESQYAEGEGCAIGHDFVWMRRDYRRENVGANISNLKREREQNLTRSAAEAQKDIFLPTQDEFRSPEDPTGRKGMDTWLERHAPRHDNPHPVYPDREKRVFATS